MNNERMPSRITSVFFTAQINGVWRLLSEAPGCEDPEVVARYQLRQLITRVLGRHSVLDLAAAQDSANTGLMQWFRPVAELEVTGRVVLTVSAADRALAEEHARRKQVADLEHEDELGRLAHLQHVLADPSLRKVWWVAKYPDRHRELSELAEALEGLPRPGEIADDGVRGDITRFTEQLLTTLHTPQQRELLLTALIRTLQTLGHHDLSTMAAHWQPPHREPGSTPA